jgi:hypothetical protein
MNTTIRLDWRHRGEGTAERAVLRGAADWLKGEQKPPPGPMPSLAAALPSEIVAGAEPLSYLGFFGHG